jgi:hypothetical protein
LTIVRAERRVDAFATLGGFTPNVVPSDWTTVAEGLLEWLRQDGLRCAAHPLVEHHDPDKDMGVWNVEYDGTCGWEVTSTGFDR